MSGVSLHDRLGKWFVVNSPQHLLAHHQTLGFISIGAIVVCGVAFAHSKIWSGEGRRLHVAFWSIMTSVAACEIWHFFTGSVNSWHAQGWIMVSDRLDLHVNLIYHWVVYASYSTASRLFRAVQRAPWAEAGLSGVLALLLYAPYGFCATNFVWTSWHSDDVGVRARWFGIPCSQLSFLITFTFIITAVLRMAEDHKLRPILTVMASCASILVTWLIVGMAIVFSGDIFRGWPGDPRGSPGHATFYLLLFLSGVFAYRGFRSAGYIRRGLTERLWDRIWPPDEKTKRRRRRQRPSFLPDSVELEVGCVVRASKHGFASKYGQFVPANSQGKIEKVYKDGEVLIAFEGVEKPLVCQKTDFDRLSVEKKVCPRCKGTGGGIAGCLLCRSTGTVDVTRPLPREPVCLQLGLFVYFLSLFAMQLCVAPETQVSIGRRQPWGTCDEVEADLFWRQRRVFLCEQDGYASLQCEGPPPAMGSQWYSSCGIAYHSETRKVSFLRGTAFMAIVSLGGLAAHIAGFRIRGEKEKLE